MKYSLILLPLLFIGCSTKISVTNINNNSLITNKNQSINIESNNDSILNNLKNDLQNDLLNYGIIMNQPYAFNIKLINLNNHSNIDKYYKKIEYFIKDKYCQKTNTFAKLNERQYNDYRKNNDYIYNNRYNDKYNQNYKNVKEDCIIEKIEIKECYLVSTTSNLNFDSKNINNGFTNNLNFMSDYNQEICIDGYNPNYINQIEKQNLNYNLYNLKEKLLNYIKPNITEIDIEIYEEVNSLKLNVQDEDLFEKSVDLINDRNYIQAKFILLDLNNKSSNLYGRTPYEITFNLALVCENLNNLMKLKNIMKVLKI